MKMKSLEILLMLYKVEYIWLQNPEIHTLSFANRLTYLQFYPRAMVTESGHLKKKIE